jgi:hypothetical protein
MCPTPNVRPEMTTVRARVSFARMSLKRKPLNSSSSMNPTQTINTTISSAAVGSR